MAGTSEEHRTPRVSVGLPVFEGERYLAEAIESILAQTFKEFELILSDNGSTDGTGRICMEYAARDSRIVYHRNERNLGVAANFNGCVHRARAEYFTWATYDDLLAPQNLEKCVEILDRKPDVVLCYPKTLNIDGEGRILGPYEDNFAFLQDEPRARHSALMKGIRDYDCNALYGLIRRSVLLKTGMEANYHSSDKVLLSELSLHGKFFEVPDHLFYHRLHEGISTYGKKTASEMAAWFDPSRKHKRVYPKLRRFVEFNRAIMRSPLRLYEKIYCSWQVVLFYLSPEKWKRLFKRLPPFAS